MTFFTTNYRELREQLQQTGKPSAALAEIIEKGLDGSIPDVNEAKRMYQNCSKFDYEARYGLAKLNLYSSTDLSKNASSLIVYSGHYHAGISVLAYYILKNKFYRQEVRELGYEHLFSAAAKKNPEAICIINKYVQKGSPFLPQKFFLLRNSLLCQEIDCPYLQYIKKEYSIAADTFHRHLHLGKFACLKHLLNMPLANLSITEELLDTLANLRAVQIDDRAMCKIISCYALGVHVNLNVQKAILFLRRTINDFPNHRKCIYLLASLLFEIPQMQEEALDLLRTIKYVSQKAVLLLAKFYLKDAFNQLDVQQGKKILYKGCTHLYSSKIYFECLKQCSYSLMQQNYHVLKMCKHFYYIPEILDRFLCNFKTDECYVDYYKKSLKFIKFFKELLRQGYRRPVIYYYIGDLYDNVKGEKYFLKMEKYLKLALTYGYKVDKIKKFLNYKYFVYSATFSEGKKQEILASGLVEADFFNEQNIQEE